MAKSILVDMLGEFTLQEEGASSVVRAKLSGKSRRLWILIAYLIVNRDRGVEPQELIDFLWPDGAGDNLMATLQNNVSRARALLQKEGFKDARDLFKYENGMYQWAPQRTTIVDIDRFEEAAQRFKTEIEPADLDTAREACLLYRGAFLAQASGETWCAHLRVYYQTLFTSLCSLTVQALLDAGRLDETEELCRRAIQVDPSVEFFSLILMRALVLNGKPEQALQHFEHIKKLLEAEYSVAVSSELEFEKAAAVQAVFGRDTSEAAIRSFLREDANAKGAFQCSNSVFREIVQLQMRVMQRSGESIQLATIGFDQNDVSPSERVSHMKRLESILLATLRSGDPFTRMNTTQFLVMLPTASQENADMVVKRIIDRYHREYPQMDDQFHVFMFDLASFNDEFTDL